MILKRKLNGRSDSLISSLFNGSLMKMGMSSMSHGEESPSGCILMAFLDCMCLKLQVSNNSMP